VLFKTSEAIPPGSKQGLRHASSQGKKRHGEGRKPLMPSQRKPLVCVFVIVLGCTLFAAQFFARAGRPAAEAAGPAAARQDSIYDTTRGSGYRFERGGWIYVHLEGSPHDIGVQHGYLLAPEIADAFATVRLEATHSSGYDWEFFRRAARQMLWPKIDPEYQAELQGITDGLQDHGVKLDLWDVVALNAFA